MQVRAKEAEARPFTTSQSKAPTMARASQDGLGECLRAMYVELGLSRSRSGSKPRVIALGSATARRLVSGAGVSIRADQSNSSSRNDFFRF